MVIKHLWGKNPEVDPSVHVDVVHCNGIVKGDSKKLLFRDYTKFLEFILVVFHFVSVLLLIADFIWKLSLIRSCWEAFYVHGELWGTFKFVLNFEVLIATWYFAYPYVFGVLRFIPSKFGIYIIFGNKSECEVVLETLRDNFLLNYILETSQAVESLFRLEVDQSHSVISSIDHIDVCGALSILYVNKTWSNFSIWVCLPLKHIINSLLTHIVLGIFYSVSLLVFPVLSVYRNCRMFQFNKVSTR